MPAEDVHAGRQRVLWELAETPSHPSVSVTSDSAAISLSLAFGKARSVGEPRDLVYRLPFKHSSRLREEQGQFQKKPRIVFFLQLRSLFSAAYSIVVIWRAPLPFGGKPASCPGRVCGYPVWRQLLW